MNLLKLCPACGKTVHATRRYCDCRADLRQATFTESANPPQVEKINFESPGLTCNDCPEDCKYCFSFAEPETNRNGFGGKDCRHQITGTARCYCCQVQVKIATEIGRTNFTELIREIAAERRVKTDSALASDLDVKVAEEEQKNLFQEAADIILRGVTQPIRKRINLALAPAG
jgi:hypothetical protein